MSGEWKDIAVIIDGLDPPADRVRSAAALRLSHHHGARLSVYEQGSADDFDRLILHDIADDAPYAGVEFCGIENNPLPGRHHRTQSSLNLLRRAAQDAGNWSTMKDGRALLEAVRCADLVIAGSPLVSGGDTVQEVADVIVRAGRPVLIVPREFALRPPERRKIGHRVMVAWNATAPAARAVHDALPLLRRAENVVLLFVDYRDDQWAKNLTAAMSEHLKRHGVSVRSEVNQSVHTPAQTILDRIVDLDIDLLVMGAFSRSVMAESWFGGVSDGMIQAADIPILTSH